MAAWSQPAEVVHTSTFAGAPLGCATALATLQALESGRLVERARRLGEELSRELTRALAARAPSAQGAVRGAGLMLGIDLGAAAGLAFDVQRSLLARGYITSLGGGRRESIVLTPPLDIAETLLEGFVAAFQSALAGALG
jgi:4-aminobutyrate aminotransferase-like enzyme